MVSKLRPIVLLHATSGKAGRGKLKGSAKRLVELRLRQWREWFPHGAHIDEKGRLIARSERSKR